MDAKMDDLIIRTGSKICCGLFSCLNPCGFVLQTAIMLSSSEMVKTVHTPAETCLSLLSTRVQQSDVMSCTFLSSSSSSLWLLVDHKPNIKGFCETSVLRWKMIV